MCSAWSRPSSALDPRQPGARLDRARGVMMPRALEHTSDLKESSPKVPSVVYCSAPVLRQWPPSARCSVRRTTAPRAPPVCRHGSLRSYRRRLKAHPVRPSLRIIQQPGHGPPNVRADSTLAFRNDYTRSTDVPFCANFRRLVLLQIRVRSSRVLRSVRRPRRSHWLVQPHRANSNATSGTPFANRVFASRGRD